MTLAEAKRNAKIAGIVLLSIVFALIGLRVVNLATVVFYFLAFFAIKAVIFVAVLLAALLFLKNRFNA